MAQHPAEEQRSNFRHVASCQGPQAHTRLANRRLDLTLIKVRSPGVQGLRAAAVRYVSVGAGFRAPCGHGRGHNGLRRGGTRLLRDAHRCSACASSVAVKFDPMRESARRGAADLPGLSRFLRRLQRPKCHQYRWRSPLVSRWRTKPTNSGVSPCRFGKLRAAANAARST
jgi:hypothetical protein